MFDYGEEESRTWTDVAQICLNGHVVNSSSENSPIHNKKFCPDCGEPSITQCPLCKGNIAGDIHYTNVIGASHYKAPVFCAECGKPYPWTERKLKAAKELATELEDLSPEERKTLDKSIDEISRNSPQAAVGATRFKKLMLKVGSSASEILKDVITDVASETAKKVLLGNS